MGIYQNWLNSGRGNVILSLPMKDASTAHINETGINHFTQNGILATADVGANEWQCRASKFDGVDDYLSRSSAIATDGKQLTMSAIIKQGSAQYKPISFSNSTVTNQYHLYINCFDTVVEIAIVNNYTTIFNLRFYTYWLEKQNHFCFSVDLSDVNKRKAFLNGADISSWNTYVNSNIPFSLINTLNIGKYVSQFFNGSIGELYFDTNYIDLATNNPFWSAIDNKPVPVRKAMQDTGAMPLIAMPIDASNPGKNYGISGDFTLFG